MNRLLVIVDRVELIEGVRLRSQLVCCLKNQVEERDYAHHDDDATLLNQSQKSACPTKVIM